MSLLFYASLNFLDNNFKPTGAYSGEMQQIINGQYLNYAYKQSPKNLFAHHSQHKPNVFLVKSNAEV